jgi:hypothetical protein
MRAATWRQFARASTKQIVTRARHKLRGREISPQYDLTSNIAYLYRKRRQIRRMSGPRMTRLGDLEGKRFVFFPLATEPEMTLQGLSPEYFFQLEAIAAIARELPADVVLAVKEHVPACGARSDLFYDQIESFKNVVMLDIRERGVDVIRRAEATVTISGSAGFEAAAMGKPTLVLGRHNIYDFLPHVRVVTDTATMGEALDAAFSGSLAGPDAVAHGALMLKAIESISYDMDAFDPFSSKSDVVDRTADDAYDRLLESLGGAPSGARLSHA